MFLGVDVGMRFTKAVLWDGEIVSTIIEETRGDMKPILERIKGVDDFKLCCSTGSGAELVDFAEVKEDDVVCLAIAARDIVDVDFVLDIGGQSITAISVDKEGNVIDFMRNDKCASGSGRFLEVMSSALGIEIEDVDTVASKANRKLSITSQCAVFAESEVISYVNEGESKENIIAAVCDSIAKLAVAQANRFGMGGRYTITGGVAGFKSITERIAEAVGGEYVEFPQPQLAAAIGAAIVAEEEFGDV
ncbi:MULTISPECIES: acyl-CoA dehydratase activase [unclassified Archaeoglobus]|jgi:predicted CoA-substrate-specific enzyme activase|uniref:acyl-CoA dehydratase activase n=1 Tax=unclassified Archaeoglobus TaxID=2643606 RepID=UPI0025C6460A|nr:MULTISPECIES: acyl-CoA dehydratase activase [unclassified Archaeoglobus]